MQPPWAGSWKVTGQKEAEPLKHLSGQICQICGDDVGLTADGDLFVACKECAFPVCRRYYEYKQKDGNQSCPQCKTRYKRHKGSPRVQGDEEEDEADDLGSEFNYPPPGNGNEKQKIAEAMLHWQMTYGRGEDVGAPTSLRQEIPQPEIPRLTNGQPVSGELPAVSPEHHSIAPPTGGGGGGKRVYPLPYADGAPPVQVRIVDPSREFSSYGFGNVAWKERVDSWKTKQEKNMLQMTNGGQYVSEGKGGDMDGGGGENGEDLPMNDEARQPLSRKVSIPSSKINPYRMVIVLRLVILCIFFHYRIRHPVRNAYALWFTSVICEIWFAIS